MATRDVVDGPETADLLEKYAVTVLYGVQVCSWHACMYVCVHARVCVCVSVLRIQCAECVVDASESCILMSLLDLTMRVCV